MRKLLSTRRSSCSRRRPARRLRVAKWRSPARSCSISACPTSRLLDAGPAQGIADDPRYPGDRRNGARPQRRRPGDARIAGARRLVEARDARHHAANVARLERRLDSRSGRAREESFDAPRAQRRRQRAGRYAKTRILRRAGFEVLEAATVRRRSTSARGNRPIRAPDSSPPTSPASKSAGASRTIRHATHSRAAHLRDGQHGGRSAGRQGTAAPTSSSRSLSRPRSSSPSFARCCA